MKTSRGVIICCLLAAAALSCESTYPELNSLNDLDYLDDESYDLLQWFANNVDIDNGVVLLNVSSIIHNRSHVYMNNEGLLPRVQRQYWTFGNVWQTSSGRPDHRRPNMARIVYRVQEPNTIDCTIDNTSDHMIVGQVYLTQHYNPDETYRISTSLLVDIREQ